MRKPFKFGCIAFFLFLFGINLNAQQWEMKTAPLMTPFAATIDTANVLGEYPRPQMVREKWMNLNGIWQYQTGTGFTQAVPTGTLSAKILVPFPVESAISGVMQHAENMWYRRTFTIPTGWNGKNVLIHFGAVDFKCEVYINRQSMGIHTGGYDPFIYDITSKLTVNGPQEITVKVTDPTDAGGQPRGKQTLSPGGIMYTCTSGIWQSVWLEPIPTTAISEIKLVPDVDNSYLKFKAVTKGSASNLTVTVEVKDGETTVSNYSGNANTDLVIPIPNAKLWSPDSPFLYDLKITLKSGSTKIDSLSSYFGMRKISMAQVGDYQKMMLNNEFLFQLGPLDQGFWPDGIYTAPTDLAIKNDLQKVKDAGFNMIRKHIKVEPYRWYYWADKLGILVWQDMPSVNSYTSLPQPIDKVGYKSELERMVQSHWNSPSIVMWVIFNEGQGQHDTPALVADVKTIDPSRLVNQASGGNHEGVGDIMDIHSYPPPSCPTSTTQILACGEYGGIGYSITDHIWNPGFGYVMVNSGAELLDMYSNFADQLTQYKTNNGLSAAVYTELTDVEVELNGFLTYDRAITKADITKFHEINQLTIKNDIYLTDILPTSQVNPQNWKYTTNHPTSNWYTTNYNDNSWTSAQGGFGTAGTPGAIIKTEWNTSDIWMRQLFNPGVLTASMLDSLVFVLHHDEDCEIYINGILSASYTGYTSNYQLFPFSTEAKNAMLSNQTNLISIHCHQTIGGQYIDAGISLISYENQQILSAVNTPKTQNNCKIYPNPVTDKLSVIKKNDQTKLVGIYNLIGCEVMKLNITDNQVDVSSLSSGVYFIKSNTEGETETISFMKK